MGASTFISWLFFSYIILTPFSVGIAQDVCKCDDKKASSRFRSAAKHVSDFESHPKASRTITPDDILKWQKDYKFMITEVTRGTMDHPRVPNTPEDTLYELKGYMWFIKHENAKTTGDCDFHIEIGPKEKNKKRVVVELTNDQCDYQQQIIDHIRSKGYKYKTEFNEGIPCTITGLGFFDGFHSKSGHGRKGKTTSSAWELHPVKIITFED